MISDQETKEIGVEIKIGGLVFCPICGKRNEVTMTYRQYDPLHNDPKDIFQNKHHRFHCSSCGSNVEFRLLWEWGIEKALK